VEKRFILFVVLSFGVLLAFQALSMRLNPPPPEAQVDAVKEPAGELAGDAAPDASEADDAGQAARDDGSPDAATEAPGSAEPTATDTVDAPAGAVATSAARQEIPQAWTTLGTLDKSRPENLLVWFTNRGAAIECIALNDARYTDLDEHHGYVGYLALHDTPDGPQVGAVGDGTPAALAKSTGADTAVGLQAGDVLKQADGQSVATIVDFSSWLETTRPGQEVTLAVQRTIDGDARTLTFTARLTKRPLEVIRPEPSLPSTSEPRHPLSYLLGIHQLGKAKAAYSEIELPGLPSLQNENWELRRSEIDGQPVVEFHFVLSAEQLESFGVSGPLRVIKRFRLGRRDEEPSTAFHLKYELIFRNEGTGGEKIPLAFTQAGPTGLPLEGWWYTYKTHPTSFSGAGVRDIVAKSVGGKHKMYANPKIVARLDEHPENPATPMYEGEPFRLQYVGVDAQYFASALVTDAAPDQPSPDEDLFAEVLAVPVAPKNPVKASLTNVSFRLISPLRSIPSGGELVQSYRVFAGPKHPQVLRQYGMEELITYGWFPWVAKPLTWILHSFYAVFRNYGIAIILLTVVVRGCMYPLGRKQAQNAQTMQDLAPEMRRISEQYKNDMEKRTAAMQELFRKHNYNPLAGCLPMFFQLPIFVGLYRALSVDIELRQAALIPGLRWCSNLAGPDKLLYWEPFMPAMLASPTGWLGPYLNILPLISVAFMMVHQKMFTPPPTDEQQEMQQRIMKFMMLFFALMFFRVPAGLCLYFITSSAWGLAERKLLPKPRPAAGRATASPPAATAAKGPSKWSVMNRFFKDAAAGSPASAQARRRSRSKRR
jgi:YidC/Oxa1 family membrane protein insertase